MEGPRSETGGGGTWGEGVATCLFFFFLCLICSEPAGELFMERCAPNMLWVPETRPLAAAPPPLEAQLWGCHCTLLSAL